MVEVSRVDLRRLGDQNALTVHGSVLESGAAQCDPLLADSVNASSHPSLPSVRPTQVHLMTNTFRLYRGLEIIPLVYPRRARNYEDGLDAAVRIQIPDAPDRSGRSRVFQLRGPAAYQSAGDARRACVSYAEQVIDACPQHQSLFDWDMRPYKDLRRSRRADADLVAGWTLDSKTHRC